MKFKLISNRMLTSDNKFAGYNNENKAELLEFEFPENLKDYTKTINFRTIEGNFFDILDGDTYTLKNNITKYDRVSFYIEFKKQISENEYEVIKTEIKTLNFNSSFNVDKEISEEEINILDKLIVKIDEATKRANAISQDLEEKVANDYYRGPQGIQGIQGAAGKDGKSSYEIWLEQGNEGTEEDFIASLEGPSYDDTEIKQNISNIKNKTDILYSLTDGEFSKNLYNKNEEPLMANVSTSSIVSSPTSRTLIFKCKPNTTYTIFRNVMSSRFILAQTIQEPKIGVSVNNVIYKNSSRFVTLTTAPDSNYIVVFYYLKRYETVTEEEIRGGIMIEEGKNLNPEYQPFSRKYISDTSLSNEAQQVIMERKNLNEFNTRNKVFGVEFDLTSESSKGTRIYDAKGLNNNYVIGEIFVNNGENDFDKVFPFSNMRRCNITIDSNNKKNIIYDGEYGFKIDGSKGNVMVEIPKFYFFRERLFNKEKWLISGEKKSGFKVAPLFVDDNGNEKDFAYVACYDISSNSDTNYTNVYSRSNANVLNSNTLPVYRKLANNAKASLFDYATLSTLQMLWVVEFADRDVKAYMQGIGAMPYFTSSNSPSLDDNESATQIRINYIKRTQNFRVGQRVIFCEGIATISRNHYITKIEIDNGIETITFDGEPVKLQNGKTYIAGCPQDTGLCDNLKYHTGRIGEENNLSAFRYRYMENLWGNAWNIVEGIRIKGLKYYYTYDKSKYADEDVTNWKEHSTPAPEQPYLGDDGNNRAWIKNAGYYIDDRNTVLSNETISKVGENGVDCNGKYYSAGIYTLYQKDRYGNALDENKIYICTNGGGFDHNILCSPFTMRFWFGIGGESSTLHTTRLVIR